MISRDGDQNEGLHARLFGLLPARGDILELGVGYGASLRTWKRLALFRPQSQVYGFDTFTGFPLQDVTQHDTFPSEGFKGFYKLTNEEIDSVIGMGADLIGGNVMDTLEPFLEGHPDLEIALLHLDMDLYKPTAHALRLLMPRMVPGGVVVSDQYYLGTAFRGERLAVDEYLAKHISPVPEVKRSGPVGFFVL